MCVCVCVCVREREREREREKGLLTLYIGWLRLVGSFKVKVFFATEPYKRDNILQKSPIILRSLLIVATPNSFDQGEVYTYIYYIYTFICVERGRERER